MSNYYYGISDRSLTELLILLLIFICLLFSHGQSIRKRISTGEWKQEIPYTIYWSSFIIILTVFTFWNLGAFDFWVTKNINDLTRMEGTIKTETIVNDNRKRKEEFIEFTDKTGTTIKIDTSLCTSYSNMTTFNGKIATIWCLNKKIHGNKILIYQMQVNKNFFDLDHANFEVHQHNKDCWINVIFVFGLCFLCSIYMIFAKGRGPQ